MRRLKMQLIYYLQFKSIYEFPARENSLAENPGFTRCLNKLHAQDY
jgi:hypothetical protein